MGHRENVTAATDKLNAHNDQTPSLIEARNNAIKAASADEVPGTVLSRWTGLSPAHVRRITNEEE